MRKTIWAQPPAGRGARPGSCGCTPDGRATGILSFEDIAPTVPSSGRPARALHPAGGSADPSGMNGFILRSLAIALATSATAAPALAAAPAPAAAQAPAGRLSKSVPVSLTILPGAQTSFAARGPAGSRFAVTDDGGPPVDLTDVHVYVREADGSDRALRRHALGRGGDRQRPASERWPGARHARVLSAFFEPQDLRRHERLPMIRGVRPSQVLADLCPTDLSRVGVAPSGGQPERTSKPSFIGWRPSMTRHILRLAAVAFVAPLVSRLRWRRLARRPRRAERGAGHPAHDRPGRAARHDGGGPPAAAQRQGTRRAHRRLERPAARRSSATSSPRSSSASAMRRRRPTSPPPNRRSRAWASRPRRPSRTSSPPRRKPRSNMPSA